MRETRGMLWAAPALIVAMGALAGCSSAAGAAAKNAGPDATSEPAPSGDDGSAADAGPAASAAANPGPSEGGPAGLGGSGGPGGSGPGASGPADAGSGSRGSTGTEPGEGGADNSGDGSSTAPMPTCATAAAGVTNCGDGGIGNESCCTSLPLTGGTYSRTYTYGQTSSYADSATVSDFRLDKYLVTVGRFRQYVSYLTSSSGAPPASGAGKHTHLNGGQGLANSASVGTYEAGWDATWNALTDSIEQLPDIATGPGAASTWNTNLACDPGYATWTASAAGGENLPINCVDWYEAYAFCIWDGGFLPSEAEWEYAAAGGSQQREYPWGSTAPGMDNQYAIYGDGESECYYPSGTAAACTGTANFAPVGTTLRGAGNWGQLDLVGEVFEWNLDGYAPYAACSDCAYWTAASNRVMRGDLLNDVSLLVPSSRFDVAPSFRAVNLGLRCARSPLGTTNTTAASTTTPPTTSTTPTGVTSGSQGQSVPGMDASVLAPAGCTVPSPVSFQTDVQGFLNASCGKTGAANASNGGCHVLDDESTMIEGGKNHAYDWITGTAHDTSCPQTPTPLRFQVVMAVMQQADPPSCSKSDIMPPTSTPPRTPLTACQMAILQSWLDEPYVMQLHRYDGISPTTPYAMPPFN